MIMIRSLVIVTALGLCGTSASALTMQECRDKYKAAHTAGTYAGTWIGFQETKCGSTPRSLRHRLPRPSLNQYNANKASKTRTPHRRWLAPCRGDDANARERCDYGDAVTVRAVPVLSFGFNSCRAAHLMSGQQEAVTGVRDTLTAPFAAQCPSGRTGPMVLQSVKRMLTAPLFACDAARSDGPWLADRCRRSSPHALRPHRGGECPALVHPCFKRQVVEPFHRHHLRTDQPVIVKFETPTAFTFVVQPKAGSPIRWTTVSALNIVSYSFRSMTRTTAS